MKDPDPIPLHNWRLVTGDGANGHKGPMVVRLSGKLKGKEILTAPVIDCVGPRLYRTADSKLYVLSRNSAPPFENTR